MMYQSVFITALVVAFISVIVRALPNGAPACTVGMATPQAPHTDPSRKPVTGTLESAGFVVKIDDVVLTADTAIELAAYQPVRMVVTSEGGEQPFRGALLIASNAGVNMAGTFSLTTDDATKLKASDSCPLINADGVTHVDNELKTSVEASMTFQQNVQDLLLDVNIVVINRELFVGGSFYYWSQYKIDVADSPSSAPSPSGGSGCLIFLGVRFFCPNFCGFFGQLLLGPRNC